MEDTHTIFVNHLFGTQIKALAYRFLVIRMDIIRIAYIYGNSHPDIRQLQRFCLRLPEILATASADIRQLYKQERKIALFETYAPIGNHSWLQLFIQLRLTDAGQTFLSYARTLLTTAQQARAALQPAQQVRGTLRVALADSLCSAFLPGLLQRYHALCPQVELVLCTATSDEMLQWLGTNQVDLAYTLDEPLVQPNLVLALDVPEAICFVAPAGHPLAAQKRVSLEELARQEFLLTERGMSYRDALDQTFAAHQLAVNPYLELGSAALLCQMVERGMGLSFLPEYIVRDALAAGTLARLLVPDCTVTMRLFYLVI